MDQLPPGKLDLADRSHDALDLIQDPETGLALLAKHPGEETPVQVRNREFWQYQFRYWQAWRAGDVEAIAHAVTCCRSYNRPPPLWLCRAGYEHHEQGMPDDEKRERSDLRRTLPALGGGGAGARTAPRGSAQLQKEGSWRRRLGGGGEARGGHGRRGRRRDGAQEPRIGQARRRRAGHVAELQARGGRRERRRETAQK